MDKHQREALCPGLLFSSRSNHLYFSHRGDPGDVLYTPSSRLVRVQPNNTVTEKRPRLLWRTPHPCGLSFSFLNLALASFPLSNPTAKRYGAIPISPQSFFCIFLLLPISSCQGLLHSTSDRCAGHIQMCNIFTCSILRERQGTASTRTSAHPICKGIMV